MVHLFPLRRLVLSNLGVGAGAQRASRRGRGPSMLGNLPVPGQPRLTISGFTLTGAGAALGTCVVQLFRTATDALVEESTSDGSGVFSFNPVGLGQLYYVVAYKAGTPDRAGTTKNIIAGADSVNIYLRDPTTADSGGAAVFRPIGSPIVRRLA